ncbi:MAG: hypothetical protein ACXWUP_03025 [Allosphingosinicella sp.]
MSRRRALRKPGRRTPPKGALNLWTIPRASGVGIVCGVAAILVVGLLGSSGPFLLYLYAALLVATVICGASILWITAFDMRARGTTGRMRPIRTFDIALGLALLLPSLYALSQIQPQLGL